MLSVSSCCNPGKSDNKFENALAALDQADSTSNDDSELEPMDTLQPMTFNEPMEINAITVPDAIAPITVNQILELEEHTPMTTPAEGQSESSYEPDPNARTGHGHGHGHGYGHGCGRGRDANSSAQLALAHEPFKLSAQRSKWLGATKPAAKSQKCQSPN